MVKRASSSSKRETDPDDVVKEELKASKGKSATPSKTPKSPISASPSRKSPKASQKKSASPSPRKSKEAEASPEGIGRRPGMDDGIELDTEIYPEREPLPTRAKDGTLLFRDHREFQPNLTPAEVFQRGSFGGSYFRSIKSTITGNSYTAEDAIAEYPKSWWTNVDVPKMVTSQTYTIDVNRYQKSVGQSLSAWEDSQWIKKQDPYGAFQWYCRFYLGRRSSDDKRQISRFNGVMSGSGRFRSNLAGQIARGGKKYDDYSVSPGIRQTLQHWGYELTSPHFDSFCKTKGFS